jgi:hypothetical protein
MAYIRVEWLNVIIKFFLSSFYCLCGNSINFISGNLPVRVSGNFCNQPCYGNANEMCGGLPKYFSFYNLSKFNYIGKLDA